MEAPTNYSEVATRVLLRAGWAPGRRVDTADYEILLRENGFQVSTAVRDFLSEFGDLELTYQHARVPSDTVTATFNVRRAVAMFDPWWAREYEKRLAASLCFIGEEDERTVLLMASDGRVFGGHDQYIHLFGSSGIDAIEGMCSGRQQQQLFGPETWVQA